MVIFKQICQYLDLCKYNHINYTIYTKEVDKKQTQKAKITLLEAVKNKSVQNNSDELLYICRYWQIF